MTLLKFAGALALALTVLKGIEMPGHSIGVNATVPYSGSTLTQEQAQAVADAAAQAAKEAVESFGKTVPTESIEGVIIQGP